MRIRIIAILKLEYFIFTRALEHIADIIVYPVVAIVVFGYLSLYLLGSVDPRVAHSILLGIVLWQVLFIVQYSIAVGALWNIWWRNLSNLFITPLSVWEFLTAVTLTSILKALLIFLLGAAVSQLLFGFSLFAVGYINLILFMLNLILFAISFGVMVTGLIFRFGTRIQALAWGSLPLLQPLTAVFYPVSVLPEPLRTIAFLFPPTYIFEAVRASLADGGIHMEFIMPAFGINAILIVLSLSFFKYMYRRARETGQFARNEG